MATTTIIPVPTILNILNDNSSYDVDENVQGPIRAKKRRLDHLSWEEKIQRKKLKNRVAAQTSRDRKKAKVEQMESALQQLFNKNEAVLQECEKLRQANERLQAENADLHQKIQCSKVPMPKPVCRVHAREWINRIPPSTERNEGVHSSGFAEGSQCGSEAEDNVGLPSLPDLLDELESEDVDINALEQLTQTLLQDIARDLESAAQKAANQEPVSCSENISGEVVGSPSEHLESSGSNVLEEEKSVDLDISEYLLLHHNYAKTHPKAKLSHKAAQSTGAPRKLKTIRPKTVSKCKLPVKNSLPAQPKIVFDEMVYSNFDENCNTIAILVNDDSATDVILEEDVIVSNNALDDEGNSITIPLTQRSEGTLSPRSDLGYESLDSPLSVSDNMDTWDSSVTELFPSLF